MSSFIYQLFSAAFNQLFNAVLIKQLFVAALAIAV